MARYYNNPWKKEDTRPKKVLDFLEELTLVQIKHGLELGHEDGHGAFLVHDLPKNYNFNWIKDAHYEDYL